MVMGDKGVGDKEMGDKGLKDKEVVIELFEK
jgi:hypothetical protein